MSTLTAIFKKLEESMNAATFAEAGEFETARQFLQTNKNARKRVLLGTDKPEIDARTISYAMHLCQRLGGGLEIFHVLHLPAGEKGVEELSQGKEPLVSLSNALQQQVLQISVRRRETLASLSNALQQQGIAYQPTRGDGCLADEVIRHAGSRRDILCVVFDAMEAGGATCRKAKENMIAKFQVLRCPVVMYAGSAKP